MVRDVVRDCLEKEPSDRTESDIRELSFTFCLNCPFNCVTNLFDKLCSLPFVFRGFAGFHATPASKFLHLCIKTFSQSMQGRS